ncbi:MAG: rhodanese-like domain-containing protein [Cytophagales bacterium]|nr:rhodanese-like domain-containing protein [Cytophagales bacterium]
MTSSHIQHLTPKATWDFLQATPDAVLIDVRMEIESMYVGSPPRAINIPWYEYPDFEANADAFAAAVRSEVSSLDQPVLLICRSGARSVDAGKALLDKGFTRVINVLHGFEGDLDEREHRSTVNGWRFDGLPWGQM